MNISVIGCGRWGSFIAWYLKTRCRHNVTLMGRKGSKHLEEIVSTRRNAYISFPGDLAVTSSLDTALENDTIAVSVPAQSLRGLMREINEKGACGKRFVLCMKGLEEGTGKRLSQIVAEEMSPESNTKCAVWLGPGHVQDFSKLIPGCMVIDSSDEALKRELVDEFSTSLIRFYYGNDLIGNEIGAAAKNVIGITAGMLDAIGYSSVKGPLMARAPFEISRLIKALSGNPYSAYGLCHLGDYAATVFSEYSHNRAFGESFIKGNKFDKLAEGCYTAKALVKLSEDYNVDLPICRGTYDVLFNGADPKEVIATLMTRELKKEQI